MNVVVVAVRGKAMKSEEIESIWRHFDSVFEYLSGKLQQVADSQGLLLEGQRRIEGRLQELEDQLTTMQTVVFAEVEGRITALEKVVGSLLVRLERLETRPN